MKRALLLILITATLLAGCARIGQSKLNPVNWFGHARPVAPTTLYTAPTDARALVAQVTALKIDPYPGGAIVRATGLPPTQGYWSAELVPRDVDDKGRLVYDFRIFAPTTPAAPGTPFSRRITVAANLSTIKLADVKTIVVQGANNALSARR